MPRYYFDIHTGSLSEWDDDGTDASGADEAIKHAKRILAIAIADIDPASGDHTVVVAIRDRAGNQVATLTGVQSSEPRVILPRRIDPA